MDVKLLFLDVDGVLNNKYLEWNEYNNGIDDKLLKYLKLVILKTGCKIVLSTTWRLNSKARRILLHSIKTRCDLNTDDIIIGQTCDARFLSKNRSYEIAQYLKTHQNKFNIISWCAIDDLSLNKQENSHFMKGHFVQTDPKIGISPQNVLNCIAILNGNDYQCHPYKPYSVY
jgi:hydroxymethylpyrimidine pyrophosphatase-like HAD family hydrolase